MTSFNASPTGWGVTESFFDCVLVGRVGRIPERSRFRKLPLSTKAREHALGGHSDFVWDAHHSAFVRACRGESGELEHVWATSRDFIQIPVDLRGKHLWSPVRWGQWSRPEHITLLEARTAVRDVQHRLLQPHGCHCRMLFSGDNLGCILALSRSRAKGYQMLVQVRRVAAWALARGVRISFRWILSEWNIADDPSRLAEAAAIADDELEEILSPPSRPRGFRRRPETFEAPARFEPGHSGGTAFSRRSEQARSGPGNKITSSRAGHTCTYR